MDTFFAVSLDLYNMKEYIIYSISGQEVSSVRELGELLFDFADPTYPVDKLDRYNAAAEYLSYFPGKRITPLLTDDFFEAQRHLKLTSEHRYSAYELLKSYTDKQCDLSPLTAFYLKDRLYMSIQNDFKYLLQFYLDTLYNNNLFPRRCKRCNSLFLAKTSWFDVLCSDSCKKQSAIEKKNKYKDKHNDEYEVQYLRMYQRWYTRIRRAKIKGKLTETELQIYNDAFSKFAFESAEKRNAVREQKISPEEYQKWLCEFDLQMMRNTINLNSKDLK